jgi:type I restriction enzyme M protein
MSVMLLTGRAGANIFHMDSLAFPGGDPSGVADAAERIPVPGGVDVVMTNPPFGTDIKIEDSDILDQYRDGVAQPWARNRRIRGHHAIRRWILEHCWVLASVELPVETRP